MDKDLENNLRKIIVQKNEAGDIILNPDVISIIKNEGYCVVSDTLADKLLHESLELAKLKKKMRDYERENT